MKFSLFAAVAAATCAVASSETQHGIARQNGRVGHPKLPAITASMSTTQRGNTTFTQLIDHKNPHLGTFEQTYWWNSEFYRGAGSPIILLNGGESNGSDNTGYLTNRTSPGALAQQVGGAVIVIEHRFWGYSVPFDGLLTVENLQHLNLYNNIQDMVHFAQTVKLPFVPHGVRSNAADVPWVMTGGSYSGALSAWTQQQAPGVFWAHHASSAPVEAISDYWAYFKPIEESMPKNCSNDMAAMVSHMDHVLCNGSPKEIHDLKAQFLMQDIKHNDDFMAAISTALGLWQQTDFYSGPDSDFFVMCDSIEGVHNVTNPKIPGAHGIGYKKALPNFAKWWKTSFLPGQCEGLSNGYPEFKGKLNTKCFDTYDAKNPMYHDLTVSNNVDRAWVWMTCNEPLAYWQGGAPEGRTSLVSRLVDVKYFTRQCGLYFPKDQKTGATYGIARGVTTDDVNRKTEGWNKRESKRLVYVNGGSDPWRECGVSSSIRPGGPLQSSKEVPINVVPHGFHCSDMIIANSKVDAGCKATLDKTLDQLVQWIGQFPKTRHYTA